MYRCQICLDVSKPGQAMVRHVEYRDRPATPWNPKSGLEVACETPVCQSCFLALQSGSLQYGVAGLMASQESARTLRREEKSRRRAERKAAERASLAGGQRTAKELKKRAPTKEEARLREEPAKPAGLVALMDIEPPKPKSRVLFGRPLVGK